MRPARRPRRARGGGLAIVVAGAVIAAGCGSSDSPTELAAADAWSRPTPAGATNGVVYLTLTTDVADTVIAATASSDVAGAVELHATTVDGGGGHSHGGDDGGEVMSMGEVDGFDLVPGEPLVFEPGGNHVMLVDLPDPLVRGEQFTITLELASERTVDVAVVVADNPPG